MRHNLAIRQPIRHAGLLGWVVFLAVIAVLAGRWNALGSAIAQTEDNIAQAQRIAETVQHQLAVAQRRAAPRLRALAIRETLRSDSVDPNVLRRVESVIPADVWLLAADLGHGRVTFDGRALRWEDVAAFTDALQRVPGIVDPEISSVSQRQLAGEFEFHIVAGVTLPTIDTASLAPATAVEPYP